MIMRENLGGYRLGQRPWKLFPWAGFLTGAIIFILIYGVKILNPFYVDWLLGWSDLTQHYLGWEFYRRGSFSGGIGMTDRLAYPISTSVIFSDSIPLFAVFFKLFRGILPEYFQYFGLWGLFCFGLQGYFSTKIWNALDLHGICAFLGNIFMVLSPVLIYRMYMHTSLGAQWLVLASIYLLLVHGENYENVKGTAWQWGILGVLVSGIHFYFFPMCFLFVAGYVVQSMLAQKKRKIRYVTPMLSYLAGVLAAFWILGGFSSSARSAAFGLGEFNLNLNAFFNPLGFSCILPDMEVVSGMQCEGFAYLGLGVLCMLLASVFFLIFKLVRRQWSKPNVRSVIFVCIGIISIVLAIASEISFGGKVLFEVHLPDTVEELYSVFRSTGRLVWPAYYLIVIWCVRTVAGFQREKNKRKFVTAGTGILAVCLCIQVIDLQDVLSDRHHRFTSEAVYTDSNDPFWKALMEYRDFKHLCISYTDSDISTWLYLGTTALRYGLTTNGFYFARDIDGMYDNFTVLEREAPKADCIYIFLPDQTELIEENMHNLRYYEIGDFVVGITWLEADGSVNTFSY